MRRLVFMAVCWEVSGPALLNQSELLVLVMFCRVKLRPVEA